MLSLTRNKFFQIQDVYYRQVINLPVFVTFITIEVDAFATAYERAIKDAETSETEKIVRTLWKRDFNPWQRVKMGLKEDCAGVLYVPPRELTSLYGTFQLDYKKVNVRFHDLGENELYVVDKVVYREPLYESCIAVELHLATKETK